MGRTLPTTHQLILDEQQAFQAFRRALRLADQRHFDSLFAAARKRVVAVSQASHALPVEAVLLAMLVEQEKRIALLESLLHD